MWLQFPELCNLPRYWSTLGSLGVIWNDRRLLRSLPSCLLVPLSPSMLEGWGSTKASHHFWENHQHVWKPRFRKRTSPWKKNNNSFTTQHWGLSRKGFKSFLWQQQVQTAKPDTWINQQEQSCSANTMPLRLVPLRSRDLISTFPAKPDSSRNQLSKWEGWKPAVQLEPSSKLCKIQAKSWDSSSVQISLWPQVLKLQKCYLR